MHDRHSNTPASAATLPVRAAAHAATQALEMKSSTDAEAEESDRLRARKMSEAMYVVLGGIRPFLDHVVRDLHTRVAADVAATLGSAEQCPCGNHNFLDADGRKVPGASCCTTTVLCTTWLQCARTLSARHLVCIPGLHSCTPLTAMQMELPNPSSFLVCVLLVDLTANGTRRARLV